METGKGKKGCLWIIMVKEDMAEVEVTDRNNWRWNNWRWIIRCVDP